MQTNLAAAVCKTMTKAEVLSFVLEIHPHEYEEGVMRRWLDELEERIACEIHRLPPKHTHSGTAFAAEKLSVPAPYDRVYWAYLISMIDLTRGDKENYALSSALFKEAYTEYARFVQRNGKNKKHRALF